MVGVEQKIKQQLKNQEAAQMGEALFIGIIACF